MSDDLELGATPLPELPLDSSSGEGLKENFIAALAKTGHQLLGFAPGMAQNLWGLIQTPRNVLTGQVAQQDLPDAARGMALGLAGNGLGVGSALAPENALGMFAGTRSKTADLQALQQAKEYDLAGVGAEQIHQETGWFKGADGQWRYEISDQPAHITAETPRNQFDNKLVSIPFNYGNDPLMAKYNSSSMNLSQIMNHPALYAAYPELASIPVHPTGLNLDLRGAMAMDNSKMWLAGQSDEDTISTALHEAQHGIQNIEGWSKGGAPSEFEPEGFRDELQGAQTTWDKLGKQLEALGLSPMKVEFVVNKLNKGEALDPQRNSYHRQALEEYNKAQASGIMPDYLTAKANRDRLQTIANTATMKYRRLAGEVEARNTQSRMDLGDVERRFNPPWDSQEVPQQFQILKGVGDTLHAAVPVEGDPFANPEKETPE